MAYSSAPLAARAGPSGCARAAPLVACGAGNADAVSGLRAAFRIQIPCAHSAHITGRAAARYGAGRYRAGRVVLRGRRWASGGVSRRHLEAGIVAFWREHTGTFYIGTRRTRFGLEANVERTANLVAKLGVRSDARPALCDVDSCGRAAARGTERARRATTRAG